MPTLYHMPSSGNSYKIRLALAKTGQAVDMVACENASPEWEAERDKAPFGKMPFLARDDGSVLPESNAILWYIAEGTRLIPKAAEARADALAWMFWEQTRHEPIIAVRQSLQFYPERRHLATPDRMEELLTQGVEALSTMERHLTSADWFAGDAISIADIALYAYTHTAGPRGGYPMEQFPAIARWLARVETDAPHIPLEVAP